MKACILRAVSAGSVAAMLLMGIPAKSDGGIDVHITIPLPRLVIPVAPFLVVIPGTYVYYPPDVRDELFFYHGYWYRPHKNRWYISADYNGPWRVVIASKVPRVVRGLPPDYRRGPVVYERVPYGDVKKHWRAWERDGYWERKHDKGRKRGYDDRDDREDRGRRR